MPAFHHAKVTDILEQRSGLQKVTVQLERGSERAYVLTQLVGEVDLDDEVIVNTTAVDLNLGTGGWHFVHWNLSRSSFLEAGPGHIMKIRYTSLQTDTGAAEEAGGLSTETLNGTPVVACGLHSQVAAVINALRLTDSQLRISYIMTDGAALPLALSDVIYQLCSNDHRIATITAGNAFGGDLEAVSLPSAMLLASELQHADVIVVGMGPGIAGTGTTYGHSGVEVANILNVAAALGGVGVACARLSHADKRLRHLGLSHHTESALQLTLAPTAVPLPSSFNAEVSMPHHRVTVEVPTHYQLEENWPAAITTMGRNINQDPLFFESCAASAIYAITRIPKAR